MTLGGYFAGTLVNKGIYLENFEFLTVGSFNIKKPGRTGIGDNGLDRGIVGKDKVFIGWKVTLEEIF